MTERRGVRRRPLLWLSLWSGMAFVVLIGLGTWQMQRLSWKEDLIAARQARLEAPAITLDQAARDPAAAEIRHVRLTGTFDHEHEFLLGPVSRNGAPGMRVVTPFRTDSGQIVLVDRGWVPLESKDRARRPQTVAVARAAVTGIVRLPGKANGWIPDNRPKSGEWFYVNVQEMAAAAGLGSVMPFYVEISDATASGTLPVAGGFDFALPNNHLQYAMTWYGLAAVLAVIFTIFVVRRRSGADPTPVTQ